MFDPRKEHSKTTELQMDYNDLLIEILNMTPEQRSQKVKVAECDLGMGFSNSDCTDVHRLEDVPYTGPVLFQR